MLGESSVGGTGRFGRSLLFVLGASSACNLLVMWGSRSETMWRAGPSRRNCSKSCGKLEAASRAVLPSLHNSLGTEKLCEPGQAARGIGSLPEASGHFPATPPRGPRRGSRRVPWRVLVARGSLGSCTPSFSRSCPWGTVLGAWELALAGGSTAISEQCRRQGGLVFRPLTQCQQMNLPSHSLCPSVTRGCCF